MSLQRIVFRITARLPEDERFDMKPQWRRCARSVCASTAEAWRKRRYPASWISKLSDAEGEAAESQVWAEIALDCGYISTTEFDELFAGYEHVIAQFVIMATHPQKWASPKYK